MHRFFTLLLLLILSSNISLAQNKGSNQEVGIVFSSFGKNDIIRFKSLEGSAGYHSNSFYGLGINYVHPINHWFDLESGMEYAKHTISIEPNLPPQMDNTPYEAGFSLLTFPIALRVNFLNYFFINGGFMLNIDASNNLPVDSQTGIGAIAGLAAKYEFTFGANLFINPYLKAHALIPFSRETYHQHLMESGIRFGINYKF